jgi:branched-chain amino acid transport system ATP-binding protein
MEPILEVRELTKQFGGILANDRISFAVRPQEIVSVIGPNGAGKSTVFHCIAGSHRPTQGMVRCRGKDITGFKASRVARLGIARTFQLMRMVEALTVRENVLVGAFCTLDDKAEAHRRALEVLEFTDVAHVRDEMPGALPTFLRKRVDLARALATGASLLMLDELMAGLNPVELRDALGLLRRVRSERGVTLLLSEHVMDVVMQLSDRVIVLDAGRKIAEGVPREVIGNERVIRAYLGERYAQG